MIKFDLMNIIKNIAATCISVFVLCYTAEAQIGSPFIHDPSTIVECDGKYYTFGTGGGGLISEDGWVWKGGAVRPGRGAAPDAIKIGNRYLVAYSSTGGGSANGHVGTVLTMWNKTLDPSSPEFKFTEPIVVAESNGHEDCDAIDAGLMMGPDGRLWLTYGTYFGYIRIVELDPNTGLRVDGNEPVDIAISCEASVPIYHDGWYYLLATHGTCCDGANSTYNIIVGRSKSPTGPYYDNVGRDMTQGGGKLVLASEPRRIGAGHFGRYFIEDGVEKMSFHFEADLDMSGRSTLGIRPLLWRNGWPVAGEILQDGVYGMISERRGTALELSVKTVRVAGGMRGFGMGGDQPIVKVESQRLEDVEEAWPHGEVPVRLGADMYRPHQSWEIRAESEAGGSLGGPYYSIRIVGTQRYLTATQDKEVTTEEQFSGSAEQLWRIEQLSDGTWRIMPKCVPGCDETLVLVAVSDGTTSLGRFNYGSDNCKWTFRKH